MVFHLFLYPTVTCRREERVVKWEVRQLSKAGFPILIRRSIEELREFPYGTAYSGNGLAVTWGFIGGGWKDEYTTSPTDL